MDYIETLCAVYGSVEKLPNLMYKFKHTHQHKGQRLSDYVINVDEIFGCCMPWTPGG